MKMSTDNTLQKKHLEIGNLLPTSSLKTYAPKSIDASQLIKENIERPLTYTERASIPVFLKTITFPGGANVTPLELFGCIPKDIAKNYVLQNVSFQVIFKCPGSLNGIGLNLYFWTPIPIDYTSNYEYLNLPIPYKIFQDLHTSNTVTLDVPWIHPAPFNPQYTTLVTKPYDSSMLIPRVEVRPIVPFKTVAADIQTIDIDVFVKTNIEITGLLER